MAETVALGGKKRAGPQTTKPGTKNTKVRVVTLRDRRTAQSWEAGIAWADRRAYWARHYRGVGANHV